MRLPVRGLLAVCAAVALLSVLSVGAEDAAAVGETVRMVEGYEDVLQGRTAVFNVTFGQEGTATGDEEEVRVSCSVCPTWQKTVEWRERSRKCGSVTGQKYCLVEFPDDFRSSDPDPVSIGEPAHHGTYTVRLGPRGSLDETTFDAEITTAMTCRDGIYRRGETLVVTTSGVKGGQQINVEIVDEIRHKAVFETTRTSAGVGRVNDIPWRVPLDYPIGSDEVQPFVVRIEYPGPNSNKDDEIQEFSLRPGIARPDPRLNIAPGISPQGTDYNRTDTVFLGIRYAFFPRPPGCEDEIAASPPHFVGPNDLRSDQLSARVNRITNGTVAQDVETVDRSFARFFGSDAAFLFNYTIPRDEEVTRNQTTGPYYELFVNQTELKDDNEIAQVDTVDYRVHPYDIIPEFALVQDEVERLESARLEVNLTYGDGSPFTPDDTNEPVNVTFEKLDGSKAIDRNLEYQGNGTWATSIKLGFEYEPLGQYRWRVHGTQDDHGGRTTHNRIQEAVSDVVDVVGAKPVIDFRTVVGDEDVNGTERTRNVHVVLHAEYKNGVPLTPDNVDPALGGVVLDVRKKNQFGRTVDVDSLTLTAANDEGDWVRTFRIGRSESAAPAGTWELQVTARDDNDPANENVTAFDFEVRPASIAVSPIKSPRQIVDDGNLEYRFRLTYPDGTLFTERLAEPSRGGELQASLERLRPLGQDPPVAVERVLEPRGVSGGQEWRVSIDASTLPPGNYFFNVSGQDIHDNPVGPEVSRLFTVLFHGTFRNSTTPICPELAEDEICTRQRGDDILVVFPGSDGDKGLESAEPKIRVLRKVRGEARWVTHLNDVRISEDRFRNLTQGQDLGSNHAGYFETAESTPASQYRFYLIGRAADDQGFAGYTQRFNITPITVERRIVDPLPATGTKAEPLTAAIENSPGDVIDVARARAGSLTSRGVQVTPTEAGTFIQWTPPRTAPTGPATIRLEGRDLFGNPFEVTLGPTNLQSLDISTRIVRPPDQEAPRGRVLDGAFELTYPDGTLMSNLQGQPTVVIRDSTGERVDAARVNFGTDRWEFTWEPPPALPTGRYLAEVTGEDIAQNIIETKQTRSFSVVPGRVVADDVQDPTRTRRGSAAQATFEFPTKIERINATVTTGSESLGAPDLSTDNGTVRLRFPTTRTTPLVQPFFRLEGVDVHGNDIVGETRRFQIDPIQLNVNWISQPPIELPRGEVATARFEVTYPDGTELRAGQGSPLVGLFIRDQPRGVLDDVEPLPDDPTVWRVRWEPPENARTDLPYHFAASALDRWENQASPTSTRAFFLSDPVVPDYLPAPGFEAWGALVAALAGAAVMGSRRRR